MIKNIFKIYCLLFIVLSNLLFISCSEEPEKLMFIKEKVSGIIQKGPFYTSTSVEMKGLDEFLEPTGTIYLSTIDNNNSSFEIENISLETGFAEISARGYYFNEITGDISPDQLTLKVLTDLEDNTFVNINVLTHLESERIAFLVNGGMTFDEAQDSAQQQVLGIFGLRDLSIGKSEDLDICGNSTGDGILLAVSVLLQGDRDVTELSELLELISSDIMPDGVLDRSYLLPSLRTQAASLDLEMIRLNITERYHETGLDIVVPGFERFLSTFLLNTGQRPVPETVVADNITITAATLKGLIDPENLNLNVTFEYGTDINYGHTITATPGIVSGSIPIAVAAEVTGLTGGATYHFRVVTNDANGTSYGNDMLLTTFNSDAIKDIENNYYNIVKIGTQTWITENLKTTKLNDGSPIQFKQGDSDWANTTGPAYSWPGNNETAYGNTYGTLYNWNTVSTGKLCPAGWHVPSYNEFLTLSDNSGGAALAGGNLKEEGTSHWIDPNTGATNSTGFCSLPTGFRAPDGSIMPPGYNSYYWSSTAITAAESWRIALSYLNADLMLHSRNNGYGYSVRCLRDN